MQYLWKHIEAILAEYDGSIPLVHFLKSYCKKFPILGSRDRRILSDATYAYYRCSKAFPAIADIRERVLVALELTGRSSKMLIDKLAIPVIKPVGDLTQVFQFDFTFSNGIIKEEWIQSLLQQPRLFLRIRKPVAKKKLLDSGSVFDMLNDTCIAIPNRTKVEAMLGPGDYWIMDASSQRTGEYFRPQKGETWWDCCSGAGGKSLLLKHLEPSVELTVSDIREQILQNLKTRFRQYDLSLPESIITDVSDASSLSKSLAGRSFDAIICDAPCTGSGTWARTPEGAYFFKEESLKQYAARQKSILVNASKYLKPGGRIIYITCSVFREENEEVVRFALDNTGLQSGPSQLINGIAIGADCLYVAVLKKVI